MVLWTLLTYVGYLAALGTAVGATAYVAATRFSLVQRLLAGAVDKALRRVCDTGGAAYSVTHTDAGGAGGAFTTPAALRLPLAQDSALLSCWICIVYAELAAVPNDLLLAMRPSQSQPAISSVRLCFYRQDSWPVPPVASRCLCGGSNHLTVRRPARPDAAQALWPPMCASHRAC